MKRKVSIISINIIIPSCSDLNRGDQALVWETKRIAEDAGFIGDYYMIAESEEVSQSIREGLKIISPILKHPSRFSRNTGNIKYSLALKFKWGMVAIWDLLISLLLLNEMTRKLALKLVSQKIKESFNIFKKANGVFVKGGGFIHSYGGLTSLYYIYFSLYHIILAQSLGKSVYVMPNSFGPFKGPFVANIVKKVMSNCKLVTSRESISAKELSKLMNKKIDVFPDLAFFLEKVNLGDIKPTINNIPFKEKSCVAITARPYRFPGHDNPVQAYSDYKNALISFIKWLDRNGFYPVLVVHTKAVRQHESDQMCISEIAKEIEAECQFSIIDDDTLDCRQLKAIYSQFDYIVGTRFHSIIFAMSEGVPGIAITYGGNKGNGIMRDMNLSEYAIPISDLSFKILKSKFEMLIQNRQNVLDNINLYKTKAANRRDELIKIIVDKKGGE